RAERSARAQTTPEVGDTSPDCRPCVSTGRSAARLNDGMKMPPQVVAAAVRCLTNVRRDRVRLNLMRASLSPAGFPISVTGKRQKPIAAGLYFLRNVDLSRIDEQSLEGALLAHDSLLRTVALQRVEVFAIARGEAEFPRVRTENAHLLLECIAHPGERHIAWVEDPPVGDRLRLLECLHQVIRYPGMALDDLPLDQRHMHDREDAGLL